MVLISSTEISNSGGTPIELGQQTSAESLSVVRASDSDLATSTLQTSILNKIIAAPSTEALQTTANTTLGNINAKLPAALGAQTVANSLSIAPATGSTFATAANQTTGNTSLTNINNKLPSALGVQAAAASLSTTESQDSLHLLRTFAAKITLSGVASASGDNTASIPAPAAGNRVVITDWIVQNASSTAVTVLLKNGASDTNPIRLICPVLGSGDSKEYAVGNGIRLSTATALILNLSTAVSVSWSFRYYVENATTGVPV